MLISRVGMQLVLCGMQMEFSVVVFFFGDKFPQILMNMSGKYTPSGGQISGKKKSSMKPPNHSKFSLGYMYIENFWEVTPKAN